MTENSIVCPKCNSPVTPGMKFCESCGARIEAADNPPEKTPASPAPEPTGPAGVPPATTPPAEPVKTEPAVPEKPVMEPAVKTPVPQKTKKVPMDAGGKKPLPRQTMIIAGILVLALLAAAFYFMVLPALSGPSPSAGGLTPSPGVSGTTVPSSSQGMSSQVVTPTLTAGPTDVVPSRFSVVLDAERDPISHNVTVTFMGGEGQYGVSTILVRLTRSDGQVLTQNFKPVTTRSGVTFPGTEKTDRVEATATFYSGEQYKILDKVFEYQKRNG